MVISNSDFWGGILGVGVGDLLLFLLVCDEFGVNYVLFFANDGTTCNGVGIEVNCGWIKLLLGRLSGRILDL